MNLPNIEKIYKILIQLPLYKQRSKEEVFLGIKKSQHPKWIGWQFISQLKKEKKFPNEIISSGLYDLGVNFWILQSIKIDIKLEDLEKNYNI